MLPSSRISEKVGWVGQLENYLFLFFLKKHPKVLNLGAFSNIFLKKHPIWANLGAYATPSFYLYFWLLSVAEGNTTFFSFLGLTLDSLNMQKNQTEEMHCGKT